MKTIRLSGGQHQLTPEQFYDTHTSSDRSPEQRMCIANLSDAFIDACNPRRRSDCLLARDWIRGTIKGLVSFDLCCEGLRLDPEWLRRRMLKRAHQSDAARIKRPPRRVADDLARLLGK
jgi:hypothetical protein